MSSLFIIVSSLSLSLCLSLLKTQNSCKKKSFVSPQKKLCILLSVTEIGYGLPNSDNTFASKKKTRTSGIIAGAKNKRKARRSLS
jgi:hypothetical protein